MKTRLFSKKASRSGYALMIVLVMTVASLMILIGTLNRTYSVSRLNSRSNERISAQNAAEAAIEKVFARMQYDFQSSGGVGGVAGNVAVYRNSIPVSADDPFWNNFQFTDGTTLNKTFVSQISTYTGQVPGLLQRRNTKNAPVYRIVSNANYVNGNNGVVGTAQEDVMLALVPLTTYAIFYNGLLEFSTCAAMTNNGPVHSNTNIYVGAGGGAILTFNDTVSSTGTISAPANNGQSWGNATNFNSSNWLTYFKGNPTNAQGVATIQLALPMTNSHSLIDIPVTPDYMYPTGAVRLYNMAQVILIVTNNSIKTIIQAAPSAGDVPAADGVPYVITYTNMTAAAVSSNLPFLTLTWSSNSFYDGREKDNNFTTQIDIGKYSKWISTNAYIVGGSTITGKFPAGSGNYPTILYAADNRSVGANQGTVVRLTNGVALPSNGGQGFSVATPNPLYVWGNYNQTNAALLNTTNTSSGTVPAALISDALTILSPAWKDSLSTGAYTTRPAANTTVNAAILTGIVPSTGTTTTTFSGGVHNLPRLLEDWNSPSTRTLTLNTSIINLFNSTRATGKFVNPGTYYDPPTRQFSFDNNYADPAKVPPGIPCALVAVRWKWAAPPAGTTTYNVVP